MSMSGKERRILAEIERALERDDPELARRVAAINDLESDGAPARRGDDLLPRPREATPPPSADPIRRAGPERPRGRRSWIIIVVVALTLLLLVLAVATA